MRVFAGVRVPDLLPVLPAAICLGHVRRNFEPHSEHRLAALGFKISRRLLAEIELNKKKVNQCSKSRGEAISFPSNAIYKCSPHSQSLSLAASANQSISLPNLVDGIGLGTDTIICAMCARD